MAWLKVDQSLPGHKKILKASDALGVSTPQMVGHMVTFWLWALSSAADGDLSDVSPRMVARVSGWDGNPEEFYRALLTAGFIESDGEGARIHNWDRYGGKIVKDQETDAERKRRERHKEKEGDDKNKRSSTSVRRTSDGHPVDVRGTSVGHPTDVQGMSGVDKIREDKIEEYIPSSPLEPEEEAPPQTPKPLTDTEKLEKMFDIFWTSYPRKVGKQEAKRAFMSLYKNKSRGKWEPLTLGIAHHLEDYLREIDDLGTQPQYVKHPSSWLRAMDFFELPARDAS